MKKTILKRKNGLVCSFPHALPSCSLLLFGLLTSFTSLADSAYNLLPKNVQLHGFLTQNYIVTTDNSFFGKTSKKGGSFGFREVGVNLSWLIKPRLQGAVQLLSRFAGEEDDGSVTIDFALLDYRLYSTGSTEWGVRGGRIKNDFGLYNETRDVAFTRPSAILPQSIYFDAHREVALSSDGVGLYGAYRNAQNEFKWSFAFRKPLVKNAGLELSMLGGDRPGSLAPVDIFVNHLLYERDGGRLILSYNYVQFNFRYVAGDNDISDSGNMQIAFNVFSFQYNNFNWSFTSEYALRSFEGDNSIIYIPAALSKFTGEAYYLQTAYHFKKNWKALLRYDVIFIDKKDRDGASFETLTQGRIPAYNRFAKDWTIGLEWEPKQNWLLRIEKHWVNGTAWLPVTDNPDRLKVKQNWRMFILQLSYKF